jgi:hypothetical protein
MAVQTVALLVELMVEWMADMMVHSKVVQSVGY